MVHEARALPKTSDDFPTVLQFLLSLPTTRISRGMHVHKASLCLLGASIGRRRLYRLPRAVAAPHPHCPLSLIRPRYGTPRNVFTTVRISSCQYCFRHVGGWCSSYPGCCPTFVCLEVECVHRPESCAACSWKRQDTQIVHMAATSTTHGREI
jgi:hypothetical protein